MHTACGERGLLYCALIGSVTFALVSFAERAGAQDVDARDAIRIASKAAGDRRVLDNLSIELSGGR